MRERPKSVKPKAKLPVAPKSRKNQSSKVRDLEKRLADALKREAEALEQQTATSDILSVISRSPTDVQPVFDAVAESAARLCESFDSAIWRQEGDQLRLVAHHGAIPQTGSESSLPLIPSTVGGRSVLDGRTVHIADVQTEGDEFSTTSENARRQGFRTILSVPLMRGGIATGAIVLRRTEAQPFTEQQVALLQTFADQAVIAIENVRLFNETKEALEQQTATADILKVISSSPTDVQPVFEPILVNATRLCEASFAAVFRCDGAALVLAAHQNASPEFIEYFGRTRLIPSSDGPSRRAAFERKTVHVHDLLSDPSFRPLALHTTENARTVLAVPLLREGRLAGVITTWRREARPFTDKQVALLQTFADQAVIAIENVRLFNETKEALEQQTATSEILRVISGSPTDVQPVFDTIARSASRLCDGFYTYVTRLDGELLHLVTQYNPRGDAAALARAFPTPVNRGGLTGRALLDRAVVHIPDVDRDAEFQYRNVASAIQARSMLAVPITREGEPIGCIAVLKEVAEPFTNSQIELLKTFADQAVIAIENVRLFTELQASNRELTTALDKQTATSDILRVISRSQTDVQPVFDAIVASAVRLLGAYHGVLARVVGDQIELAASTLPGGAEEPAVRAAAVEGSHAQAIRERAPVNIADMQTDPRVSEGRRALARAHGYRSLATVPLLRQEEALGAIAVARPEPGGFADDEIALLRTFADQAVIAIENVRLFTELQASNRELTEALEQQTATSEILRVISRSQTDVQPVFDTILSSAIRLCDGLFGALYRFDGELMYQVAQHNYSDEALEEAHRAFPARPSRAFSGGRAILDRAVVNLPDIERDPEYQQAIARAAGARSILAVPMLREGVVTGAIAVARAQPGSFSENQVELLKTFADQAVIAIENVRLFKELQTSNRDLTTALDKQTATSDILRVISQSQTDVQPVFDAIARSSVRLCGASFGIVASFDGEMLRVVAHEHVGTEGSEGLTARYPMLPNRGQIAGRAILDRTVIHVADVQLDPEYVGAPGIDNRATLSVPMLRAGAPIGTITIGRFAPVPFTDQQIELLKTFADQAVIAIENVRLFKELEARTQELTRSVGELQALGEVGQAISSTLDLQTVLSTIVARATQLAGVDAGVIYEYDEQREIFEPRATERLEGDIVQMLVATPVRKGQGATGRLAEVAEPIQLADLRGIAEQIPVRDVLLRAGYRALLAVPLVREGHLIGGLTVFRKTPGEFAPGVVELLQTFATQSALAIQNARLFREIEEKSRQLEVASQHKSEFLANMSHELRTPLNAIIGFSEVLSERMFGDLNEKQDEYLKDIYASGTHLLSLINDILDLSKIEAGRMELELTDFHLPTALDNALTLVRERAGRRSISLEMSVDERLGEVRADERKIRQVVLNLLSNAIKFTPEGGRIEVRAVPTDGSVEVLVTDTGVGIAPEDHEAVFEEFRQVGTADRKAEGTGLGLTLCRKFIELHGGKIWVKSQVGAGSTFTFTIPVHRGE